MIAEKHVEELADSSVRLKITVGSDGVRDAFNAELDKYRKDAVLPGFRKGKAPQDLLIRKFGESVNHGAVMALVEQSVADALKEVEKTPISQPFLEDLPEFDLDQDFVFSVTYDVFPEFDVPDLAGIVVKQAEAVILESHEEGELKKLQEQNAVFIEKADGIVDEDSNVTMGYVELDDEGVPREETRRKDFVFQMGSGEGPYSVANHLIGFKQGETRVVETKYGGEDKGKNGEGRNDEGKDSGDEGKGSGDEGSVRLEVEVVSVKMRDIPELDDEFAKDVSEDFETLDELKEKIRTELQEKARAKIRAGMIDSITKALVESADVSLPRSMVNEDLEATWKQYLVQSGADEETVIQALEQEGKGKGDILDQWKEDAERSVTTRLLYGKIVEQQGIEASDGEVDDDMKKKSELYKMPVDELKNILGGDRYEKHVRSGIVQEKLFDFLIDAVKVESGEKIDYLELIEG